MWAKAHVANSSHTKAATSEDKIVTLQKVHWFLSFPVRHIEWMMVSQAALLASCENPQVVGMTTTNIDQQRADLPAQSS